MIHLREKEVSFSTQWKFHNVAELCSNGSDATCIVSIEIQFGHIMTELAVSMQGGSFLVSQFPLSRKGSFVSISLKWEFLYSWWCLYFETFPYISPKWNNPIDIRMKSVYWSGNFGTFLAVKPSLDFSRLSLLLDPLVRPFLRSVQVH